MQRQIWNKPKQWLHNLAKAHCPSQLYLQLIIIIIFFLTHHISLSFYFNFFFLLFSLIHTRTRLLYLRASTSVHGYSCKIHKAALFTHFGQKNTHISGCKIVQNIHPAVQMNSNRVNIHGYCSHVNNFFILFSLSIKLLLSTITTTQQPSALE